jgi:hypothetical protein
VGQVVQYGIDSFRIPVHVTRLQEKTGTAWKEPACGVDERESAIPVAFAPGSDDKSRAMIKKNVQYIK